MYASDAWTSDWSQCKKLGSVFGTQKMIRHPTSPKNEFHLLDISTPTSPPFPHRYSGAKMQSEQIQLPEETKPTRDDDQRNDAST